MELKFDFSPKQFIGYIPKILEYVATLIDGDYTLEIHKKKKKRSINANDYMWTLCEKLAFELSKNDKVYTKLDIYRKAILEVGIYKDFHLSNDEAETLRHSWSMLGVGWISELVELGDETSIVRCYYGSSQYNTKQFSRLLDYIIQDCKAVGIETETPDEIAKMVSLLKEKEK